MWDVLGIYGKISKNKSFNNIEYESIAFNSGDGLLCFTHFEYEFNDNDLAQSMAEDFKGMKKLIINK